jgi:hypothetical protein
MEQFRAHTVSRKTSVDEMILAAWNRANERKVVRASRLNFGTVSRDRVGEFVSKRSTHLPSSIRPRFPADRALLYSTLANL